MLNRNTHREVALPRMSARYLADYMAASDTARRSLLRKCKYPAIARIVQHDQAKTAVSRFLCFDDGETDGLRARAGQLRAMMADDDFGRDVLDVNADYIDQFARVAGNIALPVAERQEPGNSPPIMLEGVTVTAELHLRLRRRTRNNQIKVGGAMLRYAKNRPLDPAVAAWQSAFLLGYLRLTGNDPSAEPEAKLCLTIDAFGGTSYAAPGNSDSRFKNMEAACATIADSWDKIKPPPNAVF